MLAVTQTALPGLTLSVPGVVERAAQPYAAIRVEGAMRDLPKFAPPKFSQLHEWMHTSGVQPGEGFFRYRRFGDDGSAIVEVATFTATPQSGDGDVRSDMLPAGRYATATLTGPYDRLYDAFLMLNGWVTGRGLQVAGTPGEPGCQAEIYRISPAQTPDGARWETDLLLLLRN